MTSLASQVAVELVDNQGNLSKTLRVLGSSETVKATATATAMAIGGALAGFDQVLDANVPADKARLPALIKDEGWSKIVQRVAGQSVISSSLNTATNGGSFKDNLTNALLINLGNQINAEGANLIGDNGDILGLPGKAVSHAVLAGISAEIGTGAIASGSTLVVGKTADAAKTLAQQTVKTVDESLKSRVFNTQPVADLVKAQTATDARLSAQTAEKLQALQKTSTDQLVKVFDPKQSESKLSVFGQQFEQVLGEGGGNKSGTTKVFATEKLSRQEIIDYAQSLAGAVPLEAKNTPQGMVYYAKKDGVTINLREYSDSKEQTKARWTIDIIGNESLEALQGKVKKRIEIKLR
ncbi:TPA: DUF637 domain-containing protein [Serratia liquefaciens]|nr:DUF637 domain-containing protein [Serratia liquefaciens]